MAADAKKTLIAALALLVTGFTIYANTLESPFVFDDEPSILANPFIESLWPLSSSFGAPPGAGSSGRPLVSFSLALNYAIGGRNVLGYHLFNIATLVLGSLALFGLTRRVLLRTSFAGVAFGMSFSIALLWMVHPLHTDTLNHVVYRNGSMMGLFYLLSLYCAMRAFETTGIARWSLLCVLSAAAAMTCKEVAVSLPLAVLAFDRQFGARGFAVALKARPKMYAGLAATWGILALCVLSGDRGESVGYGHVEILSGIDYLRTQMLALTRYLRLSSLSAPFVFDYHGLEVVRDWGSVANETAIVGICLAASIWGFARRSAMGLVGLSFFVLLAPTSSVIPLGGELIGEHRMYLPLAALVAIAVVFVRKHIPAPLSRLRWFDPALVLICAGVLAWATVERNRDYSSRVTLWQDTTLKVPNNPRAWNHLATALKDEGRLDEAEQAFLRTLEVDPKHGKASFNYGNLLFERGDIQGALARYRTAARHNDDDENIRFNHGYALIANGMLKEGLSEYRAALAIRPGWDRPLMLLAWSLATTPDDSVRDGAQALRLARELNERNGYRLPRHLDTLAAAQAETGDFVEAEKTARKAVQAARDHGRGQLAQEIEARLLLYSAGRPFRAM